MTLRTLDEIKQFYINGGSSDLFDFTLDALAEVASRDDLEALKGIAIKKQCDLSEYSNDPMTEQRVIDRMREYMPFALEKATYHRGLSAGRSINRFGMWLWLVGKLDHPDDIRDEYGLYPNYGAPILKKICKDFDFEWPDTTTLNLMAEGKQCDRCQTGAESGCSR